MLAKGWTAPEPGKTVEPPAELVALRAAVESAAKKGENVEDIRKQLETVEKTLTGKVQAKPKPLPPPIDPIQPIDPLRPFPLNPPAFPPGFPQPFPPNPRFIPGGGAIDAQAIQKAQDTMRRAAELLLKNPNDAEGLKMMQEAQDMLLKAMTGGRGGLAPGLLLPDIGGGRVPERFRLGVRLERVSELAAEQLGLEVARGVGITAVIDGSPADKAGFKTHDIVLEFAGKPVSDNPEDFTRLVSETKANEKVNAVVMRKGKKMELTGIELPEAQQFAPRPNPIPFPVPNLKPVPRPINPNRDLPERGLRPGGQGFGGRNGNSVSYTINNGQLTIKATQDGVTYEINAQRTGEEIEVSKVVITDGNKTTEAEKMDKVPEQYRPTVEKLLKGISLRNRRADPDRPVKDN